MQTIGHLQLELTEFPDSEATLPSGRGEVFLTLLQCPRLCEAVIAEVSFQDGQRSSVS